MLSIVTRTPVVDHPYLEKCKDSVEKALINNVEHKIIIIDNLDDFNVKTFNCKDLNDYIAFVDYDDYIHPSSISLCLDAIKKYSLDVVFTNENIVHLINNNPCPTLKGQRKYNDIIKEPMSVHHLVVMKSNLIDEKALLLANKYNIGIEWFMIASTVLKGKVMHIPKSLYTWTRSPSQKSVIQQQMFRSNISKMQTDIKNTWGEREGPIEQIRI